VPRLRISGATPPLSIACTSMAYMGIILIYLVGILELIVTKDLGPPTLFKMSVT
jgi:hypothetical protein